MRKILASFLILLVFATAMMCFCDHGARAAVPASHHSDSDHHHESDTSVVPDCSGTDMQVPQQASVSKPDVKHSLHFDYVRITEPPVWTSALVSTIRGPPPDWPDLSQTHPSILLITQRLLI